MSHLELVALVVREYDRAIDFFVNILGFDLVEDVPSLTNDGRAKRWVVVRPAGGETGILLARADRDHQVEVVGKQFAGRVGFFLTSVFARQRRRYLSHKPVLLGAMGIVFTLVGFTLVGGWLDGSQSRVEASSGRAIITSVDSTIAIASSPADA